MKKSQVIESIDKLPEEFSIDELIESVIILDKIDKGRTQIKEGKINSEEQTKIKLSKWLK